MNISVINSFFEENQPCPSEINGCDELKKQYFDELNKITSEGCTSCQKNQLKMKYIEILSKGSEQIQKAIDEDNAALADMQANMISPEPPPPPQVLRPTGPVPPHILNRFKDAINI